MKWQRMLWRMIMKKMMVERTVMRTNDERLRVEASSPGGIVLRIFFLFPFSEMHDDEVGGASKGVRWWKGGSVFFFFRDT
jgi:hypothetical protein